MHRICGTLLLALAPVAGLSAAEARLVSPDVHADGSVTFRIKAPLAQAVAVTGDWDSWKEKKPLTKGDGGVWSVTLGPWSPDIFQYTFELDGLALPDPENPWLTSSTVWGKHSFVEVKGDGKEPWALRDVPHGTLATHTYVSRVTGQTRRVVVYTPPSYAKGNDRYPVLFLLHGFGGDETDWTAVGRAQLIADALIADRKARPCLIVMPDTHAVPAQAEAGPPDGRYDWSRNVELFDRDLAEEVVPLIEARYRTSREPEDRAVAGLSMGGALSFTIGLAHLEHFAWVGSMSGGSADTETLLARRAPDVVNRKLRLLWIACGRGDTLIEGNRQLVAQLAARGIHHVWKETEGGHTWLVWRRNLAELLPLLFRR